MEGKAQTVTGPIDPAELGAVMMQEHLLIDLSGVNVPQSVAGPTGEHFWKEPCDSLEVSGGLRFCERPLHPTPHHSPTAVPTAEGPRRRSHGLRCAWI